jgi:hypothetical protein
VGRGRRGLWRSTLRAEPGGGSKYLQVLGTDSPTPLPGHFSPILAKGLLRGRWREQSVELECLPGMCHPGSPPWTEPPRPLFFDPTLNCLTPNVVLNKAILTPQQHIWNFILLPSEPLGCCPVLLSLGE